MLVLLLTSSIFSLGCLLLCIAVLRSGLPSRWAGIPLLAGILLAFWPPLPQLLGTIGGIILGVGYVWIGYAFLVRVSEQAVKAQVVLAEVKG